jgi:CHAT domain-containing protein/tetratricopeptide (TPR) repeat protein
MPRHRARAAVTIALAVAGYTADGAGGQDAASVRALLDAGRFEQAETRARAALAALPTAGGPELATAELLDDLVAALVLNGRGADAEALRTAERSLAIRERVQGIDAARLTALANLADVLAARGDFDRASAIATRASSVTEAGYGADSVEHAVALDRLGRVLSSARRLDEALGVLGRSLELKERHLQPADVSLARTLEELALVLQRKGEYRRAAQALRRAVQIQEANDARHPAYVTTLNLVAQQQWFDGDLSASRQTSERAVQLAEESLRGDHPTTALSLRFLAATLSDLGALAESLAMTRRALEIAERTYGPSSHLNAEYVSDLGIVERDFGNYEAARSLLQRAIKMYEERYGEANDLVASTLNALARVSAKLGDYAAASQAQSRAVAIFSQRGGPNHPFVAVSLTRLAMVYSEEGQPSRARPLLERAVAIHQRNLGPEHRDLARTLADLASVLASLGRTTRAQQLATRAVRIWEGLDAPDAPEFATVLALYGDLQARRGDFAAARDFYARSLTIRGKVFGHDNPLYAEGQVGLAAALAHLRDPFALQTAIDAERKGRDHLRLMLRSLPERQALQYAAARPRGLNVMLSLAAATPEAVAPAFDGLVRSRALVLDEVAARRGIGRASGDDTSALRQTLGAAQQRLANLLVRGPGSVSAGQYAALVDSARQESEAAEQALAERSAAYRAERSRAQVGADDVIAGLPDDAALVAFVHYERTRLPASTAATPAPVRPPGRDVPSYAAFVLRRGQAPALVALGADSVIDGLIARWRADVAAVAAPAVAGTSPGEPARASGLALRQRVWDRLTPHLAGVNRVFVVPDGALALVPFAALPVGQRSYLLERGPVIHYLSAERDIVAASSAAAKTAGLLALGGAAFDDRSVFAAAARVAPASAHSATGAAAMLRGAPLPCGDLRALRFPALTGTRQEVRDVSAAWPSGYGRARVLVGRDADERTFKHDAPGHRVLHVATHGFFLDGDCAPATSAATRGVGGLATTGRPRRSENPLRLSGLALAGANRRAAAGPEDDDGILTAEEVASLDLDGVEWAVLSACDTGLGEIRAGEGVFGLRRAFQVAGARTVIMSLWSVDDQATRAWMRALYEGRLRRGLSTADAVYQASLTTLRDRRARGLSTHPFYWAAFVAAGDWR